MLLAAAAIVGLSLTTSSALVVDPETSAIDPPSVYHEAADQVVNPPSGALLGNRPSDRPGAPANEYSIPKIDSAPQSTAGASEHQAEEAQIRQNLKSWEARVENYRRQAKQSGSADMKHEGDMLGRQFILVANQWQKLRQVSGDDWSSEKKRLDKSLDDLQHEWTKAQQSVAQQG